MITAKDVSNSAPISSAKAGEMAMRTPTKFEAELIVWSHRRQQYSEIDNFGARGFGYIDVIADKILLFIESNDSTGLTIHSLDEALEDARESWEDFEEGKPAFTEEAGFDANEVLDIKSTGEWLVAKIKEEHERILNLTGEKNV